LLKPAMMARRPYTFVMLPCQRVRSLEPRGAAQGVVAD
jgi:hypothetical protein